MLLNKSTSIRDYTVPTLDAQGFSRWYTPKQFHSLNEQTRARLRSFKSFDELMAALLWEKGVK